MHHTTVHPKTQKEDFKKKNLFNIYCKDTIKFTDLCQYIKIVTLNTDFWYIGAHTNIKNFTSTLFSFEHIK